MVYPVVWVKPEQRRCLYSIIKWIIYLSITEVFLQCSFYLAAKLPEPTTVSAQTSPHLKKLDMSIDLLAPFHPERAELQTRTPELSPTESPQADLTSPHTTAFATPSTTFDDYDYKEHDIKLESVPSLTPMELPPLSKPHSQLDNENVSSSAPVREEVTTETRLSRPPEVTTDMKTSSLEATPSPSSSLKIVTSESGLPTSTVEVDKQTALVFKDGVPPGTTLHFDLGNHVSVQQGGVPSGDKSIHIILVKAQDANESGESRQQQELHFRD